VKRNAIEAFEKSTLEQQTVKIDTLEIPFFPLSRTSPTQQHVLKHFKFDFLGKAG
jgi:hypothetical protein